MLSVTMDMVSLIIIHSPIIRPGYLKIIPNLNVKFAYPYDMSAEKRKKIKASGNVPEPGDPDRRRVLNVLAQRRYRTKYAPSPIQYY